VVRMRQSWEKVNEAQGNVLASRDPKEAEGR
jgi:hypothetical protein